MSKTVAFCSLSLRERVRVREFKRLFCVLPSFYRYKMRFFRGKKSFLIPSPRPLPVGEGVLHAKPT
jgi:hypothetical protein